MVLWRLCCDPLLSVKVLLTLWKKVMLLFCSRKRSEEATWTHFGRRVFFFTMKHMMLSFHDPKTRNVVWWFASGAIWDDVAGAWKWYLQLEVYNCFSFSENGIGVRKSPAWNEKDAWMLQWTSTRVSHTHHPYQLNGKQRLPQWIFTLSNKVIQIDRKSSACKVRQCSKNVHTRSIQSPSSCARSHG